MRYLNEMKILQKIFKNNEFSRTREPSRLFFIILLSIVVVINCSRTYKDLIDKKILRSLMPAQFPGLKFSGLKEILTGFADVSHIGYYTDMSLDDIPPAMQFSQAQFVLAPIILDLDYKQHEFILLDCSSEKVALRKIKELKAIPLKKNAFGIILIRKPE